MEFRRSGLGSADGSFGGPDPAGAEDASMSARIIQFGTSRFLQAHVALFVHEAREAGQAVGPVTVVQVSGSPERAGRVAAFGRPEGYPVVVRGLDDGTPVERRITVRSVDRGLSAHADWDDLRAHFAGPVGFVVSNTGDRGYEVAPEDRGSHLLSGSVPHSFPGKLAALLHHRWREGGGSLMVLPCELMNRNGDVLKRLVRDLAEQAGAGADFLGWLDERVPFANTLVDRIVSEPIEPVGAVAEPYALWAIERAPGVALPFQHPSVVLADDLEPFERLKLHVLNLGHSVLADIWLRGNRAPDETVRAILEDEEVRERLLGLYRDEIVPGFDARGMGKEARDYVEVTLERFRNPYLDHRLADIAQNHATKVERRLSAFRDWIADGRDAPETPAILAVIEANRAEKAGS